MSGTKNTDVIDHNTTRRAVKAKQRANIGRGTNDRRQETQQHMLRRLRSEQEQRIRRGVIPEKIYDYDRSIYGLYELQELLAVALLKRRSKFRPNSLAGKHALRIVESFRIDMGLLVDYDSGQPGSPAVGLKSAIEMANTALDERETTEPSLRPLVETGENYARSALTDAGIMIWGRNYRVQIGGLAKAS